MIQYLTLDQMMNTKQNTELLLEAAKNGDINEVQRLIPISNPKHQHSAALRAAIDNDHTECVKALIPVSNEYDFAMQAAAQHNKVEYVKMLLALSDDHEMALHMAAGNNHIECVKLLLPGSQEVGGQLCLAIQNHHNQCAQLILDDCLQKDTSYMKEWALHTAVEYGNTEAVKMLLPFVDPSIKGSQALAMTVYGENQECFDLLYPLSDPKSAFKFVEQSFGYKANLFQSYQDTIERAKAEHQRNVLSDEVSANSNPVKHKQKM